MAGGASIRVPPRAVRRKVPRSGMPELIEKATDPHRAINQVSSV